MYVDNMYKCLPENIRDERQYFNFNFANSGIFLGIGGWAYEAVGTIFTVKESMKHKDDLPRLIKIVFSLVGIIFIMFSLSFNFVKNQNLKTGLWKWQPRAECLLILHKREQPNNFYRMFGDILPVNSLHSLFTISRIACSSRNTTSSLSSSPAILRKSASQNFLFLELWCFV